MRQLIQSLSTGQLMLEQIPCPQLKANSLLLKTRTSLISAGTERMLLEFGRANLLGKIKQQPDKVKQVLEKIKTDGLLTTLDAVKSKLDQPIALGYCHVGQVVAFADGVQNFAIGDRIVSNGAHAEMVVANKNLCAKIPDNVTDDEAAFTVLASIALQGIRLAKPEVGETFAVIGLGLIGLIAVQLLRANGCRVIGIDLNPERLALAKQFGAEIVHLALNEDPVSKALAYTQHVGVDGVLITASTKSNDPVHQAAQMCRKRGRIVLVGVTGLELSRADFYEKELSFQVSCSYGPGRYDANYEEKGQDYPIGFVRWTEQRNFVAVLQLLASGQLDVKPLITHCFTFAEAAKAYDALEQDKSALGILLDYPKDSLITSLSNNAVALTNAPTLTSTALTINLIGAGNYATRMLLPAFAKQKINLNTICSGGGLSASLTGKKFGFAQASTDVTTTINDLQANIIVIATRHNLHAKQAKLALEANKHVFVEKPLAINQVEFDLLKTTWQQLTIKPILMVGFNRRFAPQIQKAKQLLQGISAPKQMIMTVNAGFIAGDHWTQDIEVGGGRLIGEACHFIDLLRYLAACPIQTAEIMAMNKQSDQITIILKFADESIGTIHYLANGHKAYPKERLEIFVDGKIIAIDNFRKMTAYGFKKFAKLNLWRQDKGQDACVAAFIAGVKSGHYPIPVDEIFEVQQICLQLMNKLV